MPNLFSLQSTLQGRERIDEFLKEHVISIGWPGLGDLESANKYEIKARLAELYDFADEILESEIEALSLFVHAMQDGDYVLVADNGEVYLGDVGDYFYDVTLDNPEDAMCHKRGVTWLAAIPYAELNEAVQELLTEPGAIARFKYSFEAAQLDPWISKPVEVAKAPRTKVHVDTQTIEEALAVLREALRSDDPDRRERAAVAILHYAR